MSVTLTYFDLRARGELSRLVLAAAKQKFEDKRIQFAEWPELKKASAYGSLPVLTVGGKDFFQGNAIATYLARENGLYGKSNLDGLTIDMAVDLKEDLLVEEAKCMFGSDESKAEAAKKVTEEVYPRIFKIFEHIIKQAGGKTFLVAEKLSLGDIAIMEATQSAVQKDAKVLDAFPNVKRLRELTASQPGIKEYLSTRKESGI